MAESGPTVEWATGSSVPGAIQLAPAGAKIRISGLAGVTAADGVPDAQFATSRPKLNTPPGRLHVTVGKGHEHCDRQHHGGRKRCDALSSSEPRAPLLKAISTSALAPSRPGLVMALRATH